jgi:hypothetical protein
MYYIKATTDTKPFVMIGHPKTASTSCRHALSATHGAQVIRGQHWFDTDIIDETLENEGVVISTIRNPYCTFVSWYQYSHVNSRTLYGEPKLFKDWIHGFLESGNEWIEKGLFYGAGMCNRLIKFEADIQFQLNNALADCGLGPVELQHENKTNRGHYSEYYDLAAAVAVTRYAYPELTEFDYHFEGPK